MSYRDKAQETTAQPKLPYSEFPWAVRDRDRARLVMEYLKRFRNISSIWREAKQEGWEPELAGYIFAVASLQAQMIIPSNGIGWDGVVIFGASTNPSKEQIKIFLDEQKRQSETGEIDVPIPTGRIAGWKALQEWRKQKGEKQK